jgi:hypothetical protein
VVVIIGSGAGADDDLPGLVLLEDGDDRGGSVLALLEGGEADVAAVEQVFQVKEAFLAVDPEDLGEGVLAGFQLEQ